MADLEILSSDGWHELPLHSIDDWIREIWQAAAKGDLEVVEKYLHEEELLEEDEVLSGFRLFAVPDDILDQYYRAWIKTKKARRENPERVKLRMLGFGSYGR